MTRYQPILNRANLGNNGIVRQGHVPAGVKVTHLNKQDIIAGGGGIIIKCT